jgi:hypothetical protein
MSRYSGNGDRCPGCGMRYGDFRTGLTFQDVHDFLKDNEDDPSEWRYKRRGTVLGHWHQIKKEWWEKHCMDCMKQAQRAGRLRCGSGRASDDAVDERWRVARAGAGRS